MKQSLIITLVICLFLGESFSLITKKSNSKSNEPTNYCSQKVCGGNGDKKSTNATQATDTYLPIVNMFRYNL